MKNVRFMLQALAENDVMDRVNDALVAHGDFGVYGDLTGGLEQLTRDMFLSISEKGDRLQVDISPLSGEGHGFTFSVMLANGEIANLVCETIEPEPEY